MLPIIQSMKVKILHYHLITNSTNTCRNQFLFAPYSQCQTFLLIFTVFPYPTHQLTGQCTTVQLRLTINCPVIPLHRRHVKGP